MRLPHKTLERKLFSNGYRYVIGVDEVGMACLAGPVYVCAVLFTKQFFKKRHKKLRWLRDSKQLLPHQREKFYNELIKERGIRYQLAFCGPKTIDKINIYQAARLAMKRAVKRLANPKFEYRNSKQYQNSKPFRKFGDSDFEFVSDFGFRASNFKTIILVDGKNKIKGLNLPQIPIVKGDRKVFAIACASIIAKVTRDRLMTRLAKRYPQYGLEKHKGYPTKLHQAQLVVRGPCEIHRKSFRLDYT